MSILRRGKIIAGENLEMHAASGIRTGKCRRYCVR